MSIARRLLVVTGFVVWGTAAYVLVKGNYVLGGGLIVLGALTLVIAASGGWTEFCEGLTNWLFFGR